MKYVPLIGLGLAIWGLVTLDWFKVGFGAIIFFGGFLTHLYKQKGTLKDDKVFSNYRIVSELIRVIRQSIEGMDFDISDPKAKLASGLFLLGVVDAASQASNMTDDQFLNLYKAVFVDLDHEYDKSFSSRILLFHQSLDINHPAFSAIMKGGELFTKFTNGNAMAPVASGVLIEEFIDDPNFPASVEDL